MFCPSLPSPNSKSERNEKLPYDMNDRIDPHTPRRKHAKCVAVCSVQTQQGITKLNIGGTGADKGKWYVLDRRGPLTTFSTAAAATNLQPPASSPSTTYLFPPICGTLSLSYTREIHHNHFGRAAPRLARELVYSSGASRLHARGSYQTLLVGGSSSQAASSSGRSLEVS